MRLSHRMERHTLRALMAVSTSFLAALLWLAVRGAPQAPLVSPATPTVITFEPHQARHVRLVLLKTSTSEPCIDELEVYSADHERNLALAQNGSVASASSCISGYASHRIAHLNDGQYGNARSWIAATANAGEWAQITLPDAVSIERVVFSRDRKGQFADRVPLWLDVLTSLDGTSWRTVAEFRGEPAPSGASATGRSIAFRQEHARHVRLSVLGTDDATPPALSGIRVYGVEPGLDLASPSAGGRVTTSSGRDGAARLNDDDPATFWNAAEPAQQWVSVSLSDRLEVNRIEFDRAPARPMRGFPAVFTIDISLDGRRWKTVAREGWPALPPPPPAAPISQHAVDGNRAPREDELGCANLSLETGTRVSASGVIPGMPDTHAIAHLTDGRYGNGRSWIADSMPAWVQLDFHEARWVYRVAFGSDRTGGFRDRVPTRWRIMAEDRSRGDDHADRWRLVAVGGSPHDAAVRAEHVFRPILTKRLRVEISASHDGVCRLDELEVYGSPSPIPISRIGRFSEWPTSRSGYEDTLHEAFVAEEVAWLKTFGRADLDPGLTEYVRVWQFPEHAGDDHLPLPTVPTGAKLDGILDDPCWRQSSRGVVRVAAPAGIRQSPLATQSVSACVSGDSLYLALETDRPLSAHLAVVSAGDWSDTSVITARRDGLHLVRYRPGPTGSLAVARDIRIEAGGTNDARVTELRIPLAEFQRAAIYGLRIGMGLGGRHTSYLGRPVTFRPSQLGVAEVPSGDRRAFAIRLAAGSVETTVRVRAVGTEEQDVHLHPGETRTMAVAARVGPIGPEQDVDVDNGCGTQWRLHLFKYDPLHRTLSLTAPMLDRLAADGVDVHQERRQYRETLRRASLLDADDPRRRELYLEARMAKRRLLMRAPALARARRILCVRRHPFMPSHNYSDLFDPTGGTGGSVSIVNMPYDRRGLHPDKADADTLFDAGKGIARDAAASYDLKTVYFSWKDARDGYYRLMRISPEGKGLRTLTSGPFHDVYPTPLPDGGLAFISTRCRARYLCWRPQAYVLFRLDGTEIQPLSYANLSEWAPSIMRDGRILWTRSEYQDKGADFSHTLWSVRPDGTHADLVYGNTLIQPNGYTGAHQLPGTNEIICTLISHFGDLNGPIVLIDPTRGKFDPLAMRSLTPEVPWPGAPPAEECFRDPVPLSRDCFLCSHAIGRKFDAYVLDRFGNREMLYADPDISIMCPTPFVRRWVPPVLPRIAAPKPVAPGPADGEFVLTDVYAGLGPRVHRGSVKWIRISQEVRADLERVSGGYRSDHPDFMDWYATPIHLVNGPFGWPSFVAKTSWGLVPVAPDGSARFTAPSGKVLYFSALDADFNEVQRMRSVVQLAPGERRSCIGCHESRRQAPPVGVRPRLTAPAKIVRHPWDGRPFAFERDVQPVLNRNCVKCHDGAHRSGVDLRGERDPDLVPMSYRTLIGQGLVHYFDWSYNPGGNEKAEPLTFGSRRSKLVALIRSGHYGVRLSEAEELRIKTWIDLNCPLWPDYVHRPDRAVARPTTGRE